MEAQYRKEHQYIRVNYLIIYFPMKFIGLIGLRFYTRVKAFLQYSLFVLGPNMY